MTKAMKTGSLSRILQRTIDVQIILSKNLRTLVNGVPRAVEYPSQHVFCDGQLHARARELDVGRFDVDAGRALEDLDDRFFALHFEHLPAALRPVRQRQLHDLVV